MLSGLLLIIPIRLRLSNQLNRPLNAVKKNNGELLNHVGKHRHFLAHNRKGLRPLFVICIYVMTYLFFVGIVHKLTHLKGFNMGSKKQARRAAIKGFQIQNDGHIFVNNALVSDINVSTKKSKRDNSPIEAITEVQAHYLISLNNQSLTFATGEAGCGKTYLATAIAAERLLDKEVDKIIVTRPVLQAEEDLGFLPGDMTEKFAPFFRPVYDVLKKRLGGSYLEYCLKPEVGKVEIAPFAYMRGRTFENAVVILDEAQNVTVSQMKIFLTRMGENVTVIVNGDITQCDLPVHVKSGLADALERFKSSANVGVIEFTSEDCIRSKLCKVVLEAYQ